MTKWGFYFSFLCLIHSCAYAQEEGQVSRASIEAPFRWSSTYWSSFSRNRAFDEVSYRDNSSFITSTHALFLNYKISRTLFVGLVAAYEWAPFAFDKSFIYNPTVRLGESELIKTESFKLFSDVRFTIPLNLSNDLKMQNVLFGIRTTQILNFRKPGSPFWITSFNWVRYQWFNQVGLGKQIQLYSRSTFNFDLSPSVAQSVILLASSSVPNTADPLINLEGLRIGLGAQIKVMKNWTISPYLTANLLMPTLKETGFYAMTQATLF